jgi:hypothetical protein
MEKNPGKYMEKSTNNLGEIWQLIVGSQTSKICKTHPHHPFNLGFSTNIKNWGRDGESLP